MPTNYPFRSWLEYNINQMYFFDSSIAQPDKTKFFGILCNRTGGLTDLSTKLDVIRNEISRTPTNGYSRYNLNFSGSAFYDTGNKRWQMPIATWTVSYPEAVQYNTVVLIADSIDKSNVSTTLTNTQSEPVPGEPSETISTFSTTNPHGLANNEEIIITADGGGDLPQDYNVNIYYTSFVSETQFRLRSQPDGEELSFPTTGSQLRLRYAKGRLVGIRSEDTLQTLNAFTPRSWNFFLTTAAYFGIGAGS